MNKTNKRLNKYWDEIILKRIPPYAKLGKVEAELKEHFGFARWIFKRAVLPLIIFYILMGLIFQKEVFGSLVISLLVFLYSNLLPDIDFLILKTEDKNQESLWYDKYLLLFFAPVIVYYMIAGKARPLYSTATKPFHNLKTTLSYGVFLFVVGSIFWMDPLKRLMFPLFGVLGFLLHLIVDGKLNLKLPFKFKRKPKTT